MNYVPVTNDAWADHYKVEVNSINYTAASNNIFINSNDNDNTSNNAGVTNYRTLTLCTECKKTTVYVYTWVQKILMDVQLGVRSLAYNFICLFTTLVQN